jgi:methylenetetrahydrofolate reductase (NADPH)
MLADALRSGRFVVTAELSPPLEPDATLVRDAARALAGVVDAANVTDNQAATVKMSPLACAGWMLAEGLEPILQLTTRDRNLLALQADLLGAWATGVGTILALSGDPLAVGRYEGLARPASELDSTDLARLIVGMNEGRLAAGERLMTPTGFLIASAANPLVDTVDKLEQKLDAGVRCFQTNVVYDVERFAEWFASVVAAGITERASVLVGVTPPRSARMLEHMHQRIPGIEVDDATFARMRNLEGEEAKAAAIEVAVDVVRAVRALPEVSGVHIMAPGWAPEAVPRVAQAAGLGTPAAPRR